ncbi:DNA (cytosine-5-)-methyltransferase [Ornithinimicrobium sp. CNJ-824]|uniref:DNA (cytosine-5-)-methyltransferase n=1 Tax=Ornithinimicrobium sp. CNJ-824 TaxID=1904966 RepID=UPI00096A86EB
MSPFTFVDLFAGIGGFHAALTAMGGKAVCAAEIDPRARRVYEENWGLKPEADVVDLAKRANSVPDHTVLAAGFPCQPYSKSGHQRGMDELRGQVFHDLIRIIAVKKPPIILLENVRNLYGPRQRPTYHYILRRLRNLGYKVGTVPTVISPHQLPLDRGGRPQVRERLYIVGTRVGVERSSAETDSLALTPRNTIASWSLPEWDLRTDLPLEDPQR